MSNRTRHGRRTFLRGAGGAVLGLPFLEALTPRELLGQAGAAPKRFLGYLTPNGMWMDDWRPIGTGASFQFGPTMGAGGRVFADALSAYPEDQQGPGLDDLKSHILLLTGLQNTLQEPGPGDHAGGVGAFLTNRTTPRSGEATGMPGPSIDFVIAQSIGQETAVPYLALAGEGARPPGTLCDTGFSCAVGDHITFNEQGQNVPRIDNPGAMFDAIFTGGAPGAVDPAVIEARWAADSSILDVVAREAEALEPRLSHQDRGSLDEYVTSVREVERRIAARRLGGVAECTEPSRVDQFNFVNGRETIDICHELMALAFQCDQTRVISFMWGNSSNGRPHNFINAPGGHHDISHHGGSATSVGLLQRIDYWWYRRFAEFLTRLKNTPDVDGRTLLDNVVVFQSSDISDGDTHNHDDMPVLVAGGGAGFSLGRHVEYDGNWFGELFVSIAQGLGVPLEQFGEHGTGALPGLTV